LKNSLAQAKTGTGKTLGFLVPAIELLVRSRVRPGQGIAVLILSPTRELAIQTEEAAKKLLSATSFSSMSVVGGTNMSSETRRISQSCPEILVATPGRLEDHLVNSGLADKLKGVKCLILDEADRLLEQGFRQTVTKIIKFLPNRQQSPRQTLLFSATLADEVHQVGCFVFGDSLQL
jgi:ATP-dependent RNA helicase MSS116